MHRNSLEYDPSLSYFQGESKENIGLAFNDARFILFSVKNRGYAQSVSVRRAYILKVNSTQFWNRDRVILLNILETSDNM